MFQRKEEGASQSISYQTNDKGKQRNALYKVLFIIGYAPSPNSIKVKECHKFSTEFTDTNTNSAK